VADLQAIDRLKKRADAAREKKGRLAGQLDSAKQRFREVVARVQDAGYDPRTLKDTVAEKEQELAEKVEQFNQDLAAVESKLSEFSEGVGT
jgi:hypothetical protein